MRRVILMAVLALALPIAAFATSSVDYTNAGGTLTGSSAGLTLTGSTVGIFINSSGAMTTGNLGTLSFSTGALLSGNLNGKGGPATFAAGGSFIITGSKGVPSFTGVFDTPATWTLTTLSNGTHSYNLVGTISGTLGNFSTVGSTVQMTFNTGHGFFNGTTTIPVSGDTNILVPEPGTLGLLGTGLVGIAGLVRRKLKMS